MQKPSILIVEDEQSMRSALARVMKPHFEVIEADCGMKALASVAKNLPVQGAMVDLMLPDMAGLDLISLLKSRSPNTKIIAMSALLDKSILAALKSAGVVEVLNKPFDDIFSIPKIVQHALQYEGALEG